MQTWALALLLLAITAGMWLTALIYTHAHPTEQENPWQPSSTPTQDPKSQAPTSTSQP